MEISSQISDKRINYIIFLILGLYPLVGMGIDLIAPSLPAIGRDIQVTDLAVKNLISIYLLGYALGNFCIGFLSDCLGRQKLALMGLGVFALVSLLPVYFPNITALLTARFLQGFMIAGFGVTARAILSDILPTQRLLQVASLIATMWGIGPIIGPVIGGYLQYYFNWQACFYFFSAFSFVGFIAMIFILPETHLNRQSFNLLQILKNFKTIISHRVFMGSVLLMGITYSLLIVFNILGPFLIQVEFGRTPVYFGHVALFMGLTFLLGTFICRRLVKQYQPEEIFSFAIPVFLAIAFFSVIGSYFAPQNMASIVIPSLLMFLACGIIYPAGIGKGLSLFRHMAGSGSAVLNLFNILVTSFTAFFMGYINATSAITLSWIYFILLGCCGFVYFLLIK